jgi:hypothetical protein
MPCARALTDKEKAFGRTQVNHCKAVVQTLDLLIPPPCDFPVLVVFALGKNQKSTGYGSK